MRDGQRFRPLAKCLSMGPPGEIARGRMHIHVTDHPERASRAVGEFNGHMPVERGGIKGRCGRMHSGPNGTMQLAIDSRYRIVSGRDGNLRHDRNIQVACMQAHGLTSLPRCARHHSK